MLKRIFFVFSLCFFSVAACQISYALQVPKPSPKDQRVRYVRYDGGDVVRVAGYFGLQTFVMFADSEVITDLASGDTDAWAVGVVQAKNGFFIKPKADGASTNLTVITTQRHYNFDLVHETLSEKARSPYYMVKFTYPEDEARAKAEKEQQSRIDSLLAYQGTGASAAGSERFNKNYYWDGSASLKPLEAWDNGTFTYLRFAPGRDIPAIFAVNPEDPDKESTINTHVENDVVVVHRVAEQLILRLGNQVTGIKNSSYNPVGVARPSNTMSPNVHRKTVGGN